VKLREETLALVPMERKKEPNQLKMRNKKKKERLTASKKSRMTDWASNQKK
jgi:hypothetical protein